MNEKFIQFPKSQAHICSYMFLYIFTWTNHTLYTFVCFMYKFHNNTWIFYIEKLARVSYYTYSRLSYIKNEPNAQLSSQ